MSHDSILIFYFYLSHFTHFFSPYVWSHILTSHIVSFWSLPKLGHIVSGVVTTQARVHKSSAAVFSLPTSNKSRLKCLVLGFPFLDLFWIFLADQILPKIFRPFSSLLFTIWPLSLERLGQNSPFFIQR